MHLNISIRFVVLKEIRENAQVSFLQKKNNFAKPFDLIGYLFYLDYFLRFLSHSLKSRESKHTLSLNLFLSHTLPLSPSTSL